MVESFDYLMIKDPHFMFGFRSNIRKAKWENAIDDKLKQIIDYAKEHNIKNIFFTGDVFEKSKRVEWSFKQFQENKHRLEMFKTAGLDIYSNLGNHDMMDGRETVEDTVFGEMVDLGLINYVGSSMPPVVFDLNGKKIGLFGIDHHQSDEKVLDELERVSVYPGLDYKICSTHSNITSNKEIMTDFTYKHLSIFNIDVINCGHWHLQPPEGAIQELNGTTFLNPWNLTRVSREYHTKMDEHIPSFIHAKIIFVGDEAQATFTEIPLKVLPFSEAFNIDVVNLLQELGKEGFDFFENISLDVDEEENDDNVLMKAIAEKHKISKRSIEIAKELLT